MNNQRREFIKKVGLGSAALTLGGTAIGLSPKSYFRILGSNDRIRVANVGINSQGTQHMKAVAGCENTTIAYICDVDSRAARKTADLAYEMTGERPKIHEDFRKLIEEKDLDVVTIAAPDHWHTPMTILAVKAGKHVYVEKPCSYNLHESKLLMKLSRKYDKVIQMGNQGRSGPRIIEGIRDIHNGIIGEVYFAKSWYVNKRGSIGRGKPAEVPDWLNWELYQGPAPRREYRDNIVHYNWHWFRHWGTGEINNNGILQLDVCRWALGVDYPEQVTSYGGRYHFDDDWEFPDSQIATFKYANGIQITWEGRSCNPFRKHHAPNGILFSGTKGSVRILPEDNHYTAYDLDNHVIGGEGSGREDPGQPELVGPLPQIILHMTNMLDAIRKGTLLHAPVSDGAISNDLCHLGNISQDLDRTLRVNQETGEIIGDSEATGMSFREYEPGWEPEV
jgi:predicted dehydrogenase